ncbi:ABC transporter ATP-binding protein [Acuticoccus kandeliae]|uniref:ABC transporter ATP-binding protein n=1 Tax=Acuticoccus kandeliae TaxID=2073160 RepID=UPI000D3E2768|nr:dipeptide/oligopeptide/nickel ABC transporter ATP-binding protein [Acuticoccus kandeliae]
MSALSEAIGLTKIFATPSGPFTAVDDVTLRIGAGERVGLVGESGSGKSTVGRLLLRLIEPSAGDVVFDGTNLSNLDRRSLRAARKNFQMVFQNPHTSLHPRMTIGDALAEPLRIQGGYGRREMARLVSEMFDVVALPAAFRHRYPHELSGGQKQRVAIARALILNPKLIVFDEPTSALDVSVQAQILEFVLSLCAEKGIAYLFISHNLAAVNHMCETIYVMRHGKVVEKGPAQKVLLHSENAYVRELIEAALATS